MSFNPEHSIQAIVTDFQALIDFATETAEGPAHTTEAHLYTNLLQLGARLMQLFLESQAAQQSTQPLVQHEGPTLRFHSYRRRSYFSVFGKIAFERAYFYAPGHGGATPLDDALELPEHCYSALLSDWACLAATEHSYGNTQALFVHMLGLQVPKLALQQLVEQQAEAVEAFYEAKPPPRPQDEGSILVVQVDGKGVPMVAPAKSKARRGKGDQRTKKKEAVVTAHYSVDRYRRSADQVVAALLRQDVPDERPKRPQPQGKQLRATLSGKDAALTQLAVEARQRDGPHVVDRVALCDGAVSLQRGLQEALPEFSLVLDVIHAVEYLWEAANALLGERDAGRFDWVKPHLERLLSDGVEEVATALEQELAQRPLSAAKQKKVTSAIGYYRRNAPYMRYGSYLARGWPIASGVIEGACRHLVKDRCEGTGMRWSVAGAESVLDLRAVRVNGDWSAFQGFLQRRRQTWARERTLKLVPVEPGVKFKRAA